LNDQKEFWQALIQVDQIHIEDPNNISFDKLMFPIWNVPPLIQRSISMGQSP